MFRRSLIVLFVLAAVPVAAATWMLAPVIKASLTDEPPTATPTEKTAAVPEIPDLKALQPRKATSDAARFDVARIDPNGWSVFAGTAPAHASVTVTADGVPVGTTRADENGEWTLTSDRRFATAHPVLGLATQVGATPKDQGKIPQGKTDTAGNSPPVRPVAPAAAPSQKAPPSPQISAADATQGMMRKLEDLVAAARVQQPAPPEIVEPAARGATAPVAAPVPVPVPMQFVFREADFTEDGHKAAALLAEYLKLKNPVRITLTGHADERGSDSFNWELSRQRLETVATYLRAHGYTGELTLIPKGRSEPYAGVDRSRYSRDALYQLDRRVEVVLDGTKPAHSAGKSPSGTRSLTSN